MELGIYIIMGLFSLLLVIFIAGTLYVSYKVRKHYLRAKASIQQTRKEIEDLWDNKGEELLKSVAPIYEEFDKDIQRATDKWMIEVMKGMDKKGGDN